MGGCNPQSLILRSRAAASRRMVARAEPGHLMVRDGAARLLTMRGRVQGYDMARKP